VRATRSSDEHTTVDIRRAEDADHPSVTLFVPDSGLDLIAVERGLIRFALESCGGNRTHAAQFLGLSRSALLYRMQKYGLTMPSVSPTHPAGHQ